MQILYEDNHLIAINKPAGVASQGAAPGQPSAIDQVKAYLKRKYNKPGDVFLGVVHRLDKPVTGVLLYARTSKAASRLSTQFAQRSTLKIYRALVHGHPHQPSGTLTHYLKKNEHTRLVESRTSPSAGYQLAILHYLTISSTPDYADIEVTLETGRLHQIRAQCAAIGCPILGDLDYTPKTLKTIKTLSPAPATALHAWKLTVEHPITKEPLDLQAQLPIWWPH